jgi:translation initiation factor 2B subunit (eIF-2B alpha/beta/delta family)
MDPRLNDIAETLAKDASSGASEMMSAVLNSLLAIPEEELAAIPASEWEAFAIALHEGKPTIAPIFNVANTVMLEVERGAHGAALHGVFLQAMEEERRSGPRIAEQAVKHVKGSWFMTASYSGTVAHVLRALSKDRAIKVTVAESQPGGEGRQFAKLLAGHQIETEVIYDSTVFARMEEMDGAIVGSDSVTPAGLVNKVGTRPVAEAARAYYLPMFAVCSWSKISPVVLSDLVVKRSELAPRVSEHVQVFESTPLELFSHIITDRGMLTSADLKMELRVRKVARAWYARGVLKRPDVISAR